MRTIALLGEGAKLPEPRQCHLRYASFLRSWWSFQWLGSSTGSSSEFSGKLRPGGAGRVVVKATSKRFTVGITVERFEAKGI